MTNDTPGPGITDRLGNDTPGIGNAGESLGNDVLMPPVNDSLFNDTTGWVDTVEKVIEQTAQEMWWQNFEKEMAKGLLTAWGQSGQEQTTASNSTQPASGDATPPEARQNTNPVLYRGLRADEEPSQGLFPKNPSATETPYTQIRYGSQSGFQSQFISTTKSLNVAIEWAIRKGTNRIAVIDQSRIAGKAIDVSTKEGLQEQGITYPSFAYSWARSSQEVLIDGSIPSDAIVGIWELGVDL